MRSAHQHVRLFFVGLDDVSRFNLLASVHSQVALRTRPDDPFPELAPVALEGGLEDGVDEALMAGRIVEQDEVGAAGILGRIKQLAVRIDLQHEQLTAAVHAQIAAAIASAAEAQEKPARDVA